MKGVSKYYTGIVDVKTNTGNDILLFLKMFTINQIKYNIKEYYQEEVNDRCKRC